MHLYLYDKYNGDDPAMIIDELRHLELGTYSGTKPAAPFERQPLAGFHHKHFFSASFVAKNIQNELNRGGALRGILTKGFGGRTCLDGDAIRDVADRLTYEQVEVREREKRLTGEWIVFAKHCGVNYYLCLADHDMHDQVIYDGIVRCCYPQFAFLGETR